MDKMIRIVKHLDPSVIGINWKKLKKFKWVEKAVLQYNSLILYINPDKIDEMTKTHWLKITQDKIEITNDFLNEIIISVYNSAEIKVYPANKNASLFTFRKNHIGDSGIDVITLREIILPENKVVLIDTGYAFRGIYPPTDGTNLFELQIRSRSGLAKKGVIVMNQPGTIDAGYRGTIGILLYNTNKEPFVIHANKGIAQLVVVPIAPANVNILKEEDENPLDDRGTGGFGSTDNRSLTNQK